MTNPTPKRLILLVDDDALLLQCLCFALRQGGYETLSATSAAQALEIVAAREADISLAVLDLNMPGMSGLELGKRLCEHTTVPFMILSGADDAESARQAAAHGAVGFLVKPLEISKILPSLEAALARADEIAGLRVSEANLNAALAAGRETSLAVGLLMARFQTDRNAAFETLRDHARSSRRKLNEVAQELVAAEELLNSLHGAFAARLRK